MNLNTHKVEDIIEEIAKKENTTTDFLLEDSHKNVNGLYFNGAGMELLEYVIKSPVVKMEYEDGKIEIELKDGSYYKFKKVENLNKEELCEIRNFKS